MEPTASSAARSQLGFTEASGRNEAHSSGVSWGAVIAGAFVAAALSLALLALGTGIGFSAVSPWANAGASASAIGWTAIAWLVLMQLIASSVGATWRDDCAPSGSTCTRMKSISAIPRTAFSSGRWAW